MTTPTSRSAMSWGLLSIPVLTALAALAGILLDASAALTVGVATATGAAAAGLLSVLARQRVSALAARLDRIARGEGDVAAPDDPGDRDELEEALDAITRSLQQRLEEIKRVDAVRRDFVTNASHELKTPVAAIQALSESIELAFDRDPERARGMVSRLQNESVRLASMVRDLLDLARLEEASTERSRTRVDVADVVAGQMERVAPVARERGVVLRVSALDEAEISGLPEDVRLIVGNLLENAVRYNTQGGTVDVAVRRLDADVLIEVADTGLGIPEADRDRVFERFYRVDKGRSRAAGGTGLGLALVRHAVQRAGGRIELVSELGKGSTFTVVLPVDPDV